MTRPEPHPETFRAVRCGEIVFIRAANGIGGRMAPAPERGLVITTAEGSSYFPASELRKKSADVLALLEDR